MEPCQRGDWSATRHMTIRFDNVDDIARLEYTWVQMFDIEKRIPLSVMLTDPGFDGIFRIPVDSDFLPNTCYILLKAVYAHSGDDYGLLTAKHFSNTHIDIRGHKVKRISVLARAPLAWVKMITPSDTVVHYKTYTFTGDTVSGHQPEMLVSRIYASMNRHVHTVLAATLRSLDSAERDTLASKLVSETLSTLGAPLAFKVLHEQSRLTLERLHSHSEQGVLAIPDPQCALWGTCVLWQQDSDMSSLSRQSVNHNTHLLPVPSSPQWLRVRLTWMNLEVTRCLGEKIIKDVIHAPYEAVILTALCCGSLDRWCQELGKLNTALRVDQHLLSRDRHKAELCQRCGYAYQISPAVCEPEPRRVPAVSQIDRLLLGGICTTLCATISRYADNGRIARRSETPPPDLQNLRGWADWEYRYCLNHRRVYRSSGEEKWEVDKLRAWEVDQSQGHKELKIPSSPLFSLSNKRPKPNQIALWWEDGSSCYWGQEREQESHEESFTSRKSISPFTEHKDQERRQRKKRKPESEAVEDETDQGWWLWQKECRQRRRESIGCTVNRQTLNSLNRHRFWNRYLTTSQDNGEESNRSSTSIQYWKRFSCNALRYHIKTIPFGYRGGILTI